MELFIPLPAQAPDLFVHGVWFVSSDADGETWKGKVKG